MLPSSGFFLDSLSAAAPSVISSSVSLAGAGLPERLQEWLAERLPLRWVRRLTLRGLELRDLIFMTTVLSSSELKSELSEELLSCSEDGSWICEWTGKKKGNSKRKCIKYSCKTPGDSIKKRKIKTRPSAIIVFDCLNLKKSGGLSLPEMVPLHPQSCSCCCYSNPKYSPLSLWAILPL